ncbi:MAG: hypothetical protein AB7N76_29215 [Planctomycetota bacterium]
MSGRIRTRRAMLLALALLAGGACVGCPDRGGPPPKPPAGGDDRETDPDVLAGREPAGGASVAEVESRGRWLFDQGSVRLMGFTSFDVAEDASFSRQREPRVSPDGRALAQETGPPPVGTWVTQIATKDYPSSWIQGQTLLFAADGHVWLKVWEKHLEAHEPLRYREQVTRRAAGTWKRDGALTLHPVPLEPPLTRAPAGAKPAPPAEPPNDAPRTPAAPQPPSTLKPSSAQPGAGSRSQAVPPATDPGWKGFCQACSQRGGYTEDVGHCSSRGEGCQGRTASGMFAGAEAELRSATPLASRGPRPAAARPTGALTFALCAACATREDRCTWCGKPLAR